MKRKRQVPPSAEVVLQEVSAIRDRLVIQLRRADARLRALGETASAAAAMLDVGEVDEARLVLAAARRIWMNNMRERVAHEPGGVCYVATKEEE